MVKKKRIYLWFCCIDFELKLKTLQCESECYRRAVLNLWSTILMLKLFSIWSKGGNRGMLLLSYKVRRGRGWGGWMDQFLHFPTESLGWFLLTIIITTIA